MKTECRIPKRLDFAALHYDMQYLYFMFMTKEFLSRHLSVLERNLDKENRMAQKTHLMLRDFEGENKNLNEKIAYLEDEAFKSFEKSEHLARTLNNLAEEKTK
jgi:hypothetical protein